MTTNPLHAPGVMAFFRRMNYLRQPVDTRAAAMADHPSSQPDTSDHELAIVRHITACEVCIGSGMVEAANGAEYDCIDCGGSGRESDRVQRKAFGL